MPARIDDAAPTERDVPCTGAPNEGEGAPTERDTVLTERSATKEPSAPDTEVPQAEGAPAMTSTLLSAGTFKAGAGKLVAESDSDDGPAPSDKPAKDETLKSAGTVSHYPRKLVPVQQSRVATWGWIALIVILAAVAIGMRVAWSVP